MEWLTTALGLIGALLGGLWLLQGLGVVRMRPILCFADCTALQGPSATWAVIGAAVLLAGAVTIWLGLRRR